VLEYPVPEMIEVTLKSASRRLFRAGVPWVRTVERQRQHDDRDGGEIGAHLAVAVERLGGARDQLDVAHEGQAREDHEDDGDVFQRALVDPEGVVVVGKPTRRDRRQRVDQRVEPGHARAV
jgi:hypothetical protein